MFLLLASAAALPASMEAGALVRRPWNLQLRLADIQEVRLPVPTPRKDEVVIQVAGSSVNPCEWKFIESPLALTWRYPHVNGHDLAGTVVALGEEAARKRPALTLGTKVWAITHDGAHAEYVAVGEDSVGLAPVAISLPQAGVMPVVALTGLQAFRFAGLDRWEENTTVVVLGGSSGTGHVAIQMAKAFGAFVITTCGARNVAFCTSLGADLVIDYRKQDWTQVLAPRSVHFVYDCVAARGTGDRAYGTLADGGFFVTLLPQGKASRATAAARPSIQQTSFFLSDTSTADLDALRSLVDARLLRPHVEQTFGLPEIARAFNASLAGHTVGKVSVVPNPDAYGASKSFLQL